MKAPVLTIRWDGRYVTPASSELHCVYRGQMLDKDAIYISGDRTGQRAISSRSPEQSAIYNLRIVYFWNFPLSIFRLWLTAGDGKHGKQTSNQGDHCVLHSPGITAEGMSEAGSGWVTLGPLPRGLGLGLGPRSQESW